MRNLFTLLGLLLCVKSACGKTFVVFAKGNSSLEREGKTINVSKGMLLQHNDTIYTGKAGLVVIKSKASTYKVSKNSQLKLNLKTKEIINSNIIYGSIVVEFLKERLQESKGKTLNVVSRSATMGVRGTKFFSYVSRKNKNSILSVEHGSVSFRGANADKGSLVGGDKSSMTNLENRQLRARAFGFESEVNWKLSPGEGELQQSDRLFSALEKTWSKFKNENLKIWKKRSDEMESLWNKN